MGAGQYLNGIREEVPDARKFLQRTRAHLIRADELLTGAGKNLPGTRAYLPGAGEDLQRTRELLNRTREHLKCAKISDFGGLGWFLEGIIAEWEEKSNGENRLP